MFRFKLEHIKLLIPNKKLDVMMNNSAPVSTGVSRMVVVHMFSNMTYSLILRWPQDAHLSLGPYGLTWLQRECGEILVKLWYVAGCTC